MSTVHCTARVEENGLLSIPKEVRDELALQAGDELAISLHPARDHAEQTNGSSRPDAAAREEARIAAIDAAAGKYAHLGVSVEELHRERRLDEARSHDSAPGTRS